MVPIERLRTAASGPPEIRLSYMAQASRQRGLMRP
jgi:hypothetical protein